MSRVTSKGQVTVPKEVREKMGLKPGDEVDFEETQDGVLISKHIEENPFEKWRGVDEAEETVEEAMERLRGERA